MARQNPKSYAVTISSASVAQTEVLANVNRTKIRIANPSSAKVPIYVAFGSAAKVAADVLHVMPGGVYESDVDQCPLEYISVLSTVANHTFTIEEFSNGQFLGNMTKAARDALTLSAGLVIYQTDNTPGLRVCNGTNWMRFTETID